MPKLKVLQPSRVLSASTTGHLLDAISSSLGTGATTILINLQDVLFVDSIGLAALVVALKRVRSVNGQLALCSLNGQARMLLEQSGMEKVFEIYTSPEEFIGKLSQGPNC